MADFGGKPMISHILENATKCFEEVIVVTRNEGVQELCKANGIKVVFHSFPYRSDTIRLGIENLSSNVKGVLFCLADQPFLSLHTLRNMAKVISGSPDYIWRACCGETIGSPNYFPGSLWGDLSHLPDDMGGSYVCKKYPELIKYYQIDDVFEIKDIDTKETYEELYKEWNSRNS